MPRRLSTLSTLALVSALLWGVIELLALFRSRRNDSGHPRSSQALACGRQDGQPIKR